MQNFSFFFSLMNNSTTVYRLKQPLPCSQSTSKSAILSISAFIIQQFPDLRPLTLPLDIYSTANIESLVLNWQTSYCPLEQPWSNQLIELTVTHHAKYYEETFYIEIPLHEMPKNIQFNERFTAVILTSSHLSAEQKWKQVFGLPKIKKSNKKIGIVAFRSTSKTPLQPRVNSVGLFIGNLFRNDDWSVFKIEENHIPTKQDVMGFDCIILPGSAYSVCEQLPQPLIKTMENIILAHSASNKLKIIGVCFGHQIISKLFGAKVQKIGRVGGIEKICFDTDIIQKYQFFQGILDIPQLYLSKHHEDFVTSIPPGFKLIANSDSCQYQSFLSEDHRILTVQFHSQYFCDFTKRYEHRRLDFCGKNQLVKFYVPESQEVERRNKEHSRLFLQVFRKFIAR